MSDSEDLIARAYETIAGWLAVGHETRTQPLAQFVRDPRMPHVYDANFMCDVRAQSADEIDSVIGAADSMYRELEHRRFVWDPRMPIEFEARLLLDDYRLDDQNLVLVLEGPLRARPPAVEIRPAKTDAEWDTIHELIRLDHEEEAQKGFHEAWGAEVTRQIFEAKRVKSPEVQYFLARADGVDCAFFSAWPGANGVGQVEDLFTRSDFRGRGIGTALLAACVDDARARGAAPVVITARSGDTPKHMYAAMGFRPLCVERFYTRAGVK